MPAADAAAGVGGFGGFDTSTLGTTCQTSCTSSQTQRCMQDSECPAGQTCQAPAGAGMLGGFISIPNSCAAPTPDAGTVGNDAGTPADSGRPADTGAGDAAVGD